MAIACFGQRALEESMGTVLTPSGTETVQVNLRHCIPRIAATADALPRSDDATPDANPEPMTLMPPAVTMKLLKRLVRYLPLGRLHQLLRWIAEVHHIGLYSDGPDQKADLRAIREFFLGFSL
jgi:hypothetical protein